MSGEKSWINFHGDTSHIILRKIIWDRLLPQWETLCPNICHTCSGGSSVAGIFHNYCHSEHLLNFPLQLGTSSSWSMFYRNSPRKILKIMCGRVNSENLENSQENHPQRSSRKTNIMFLKKKIPNKLQEFIFI